MKIDINPTIRVAKGLDKVVLDSREINALYFVERPNGEQHTVKWESNEIVNEFQPNKTVSEMIKIWDEGIIRRYNIAKKAVDTGLHPKKKRVPSTASNILTKEEFIIKDQYVYVNQELSDYEKIFYKNEMNKFLGQVGGLKLVKLVTPAIAKHLTKEEQLAKFSIWVNRHCWGDVQGFIETADKEKSVEYKVLEVSKRFVKFTISYEGDEREDKDKVFRETKKKFLENHNFRRF